eukprot:gnl/TRDRNA2_/TRDRNA2_133676_c0_seq2.p1 gnl/TRDRNA2_/TRDRNA2_133676_c0~~gnl/TRDRNA2_/TRDRNA2_133676_c0_seq2.p1  ORF type:complete len:456 (+),score=96.66 gnl/TRDRNA2_/TRDRNA2_133676_c0_seq2:72-1439(+)
MQVCAVLISLLLYALCGGVLSEVPECQQAPAADDDVVLMQIKKPSSDKGKGTPDLEAKDAVVREASRRAFSELSTSLKQGIVAMAENWSEAQVDAFLADFEKTVDHMDYTTMYTDFVNTATKTGVADDIADLEDMAVENPRMRSVVDLLQAKLKDQVAQARELGIDIDLPDDTEKSSSRTSLIQSKSTRWGESRAQLATKAAVVAAGSVGLTGLYGVCALMMTRSMVKMMRQVKALRADATALWQKWYGPTAAATMAAATARTGDLSLLKREPGPLDLAANYLVNKFEEAERAKQAAAAPSASSTMSSATAASPVDLKPSLPTAANASLLSVVANSSADVNSSNPARTNSSDNKAPDVILKPSIAPDATAANSSLLSVAVNSSADVSSTKVEATTASDANRSSALPSPFLPYRPGAILVSASENSSTSISAKAMDSASNSMIKIVPFANQAASKI